jgi:hypothetical protein
MNYACTYLGEWEQELFEKSNRLPTHYWRYVDDAWGLWEHGLEKVQEFHKLANSLHPFLGTLGYSALTSKQNIIEFPGNGCGILFSFRSNSVVSFM